MFIYANILANILSVAALTQTSPQSAPIPSAAAQPAIAVKESPRARVAYLAHTGAYWTIGPVISKVRDAQDAPATIFVRYEIDPRRVSPTQLEAQVGFVLEIGKLAPVGFQAKTQSSQLVAWMMVDIAQSALARHYTTLEKWAKQNGYEPLGPVIELYPETRKGTRRIEIQLAIQKAKKTPPPPARTVVSPRTIAPKTVAPPRQPQPTAIIKAPAKHAAIPTRTGIPVTTKRRREPTVTKPATDETPTNDVDQLALRIIPPRKDWSLEQATTLGPQVMRIRTIAHLAKTKFGPDASPIADLSDALTDRYTLVCGAQLASAVIDMRSKRARHLETDGPLEQIDRLFSDLLRDQIDAPTLHQSLLRILTKPAKQASDTFGPKRP